MQYKGRRVMFEAALSNLFAKIFKLKRVDFSPESESEEQDVVFVNVERADTRIKDGKQVAVVTGSIEINGAHGSLPHGFIGRSIADAEPSLVKDLYFTAIDTSVSKHRDIDSRSAKFVFFYSAQYDPAQGIINQVNIDIEVKE